MSQGDSNPLRRMGLGSFLLLTVLVIWIASSFTGSGAGTPAEPQALAGSPEAAAKAKSCNALLATATKEGLIRGRPSPNEVEVDELMWAALPAKDKRIYAYAARCALTGGADVPDSVDNVVTIEGYRSGKQLASVTSMGPSLD